MITRMRLSMARGVARSVIAGLFFVACGSALPTPQEEQRVDDYGKALERCKASAKARDADVDDYQRCAKQVDRDYGRGDAGGG